jgi:hypothetical protein
MNLLRNAVLALAGAAVFTLAADHALAQSGSGSGSGSGKGQAHMQQALSDLTEAQGFLEKAEADKGGHREKALDSVKSAISEVNAGIEAGGAAGKPAGTGSAASSGSGSGQVNMKEAHKYLEKALKALEKAEADKGGHREKAIKDVTEAIDQVKEGMQAGKGKGKGKGSSGD